MLICHQQQTNVFRKCPGTSSSQNHENSAEWRRAEASEYRGGSGQASPMHPPKRGAGQLKYTPQASKGGGGGIIIIECRVPICDYSMNTHAGPLILPAIFGHGPSSRTHACDVNPMKQMPTM